MFNKSSFEKDLNDILNIYEDRNHVRYIAYKENQFSKEEVDWYHHLLNSVSLEDLIKKFPYVVLVYDEESGSIIEGSPCEYNGALTNNFHIAYAKYQDHKMQMENSNQYQINVSSLYNMKKQENMNNVSFNEKDIIQNPNEGIVINNDEIPEYIEVSPLPNNYHPNKDSNGNYMSGPIQNYIQHYVYNPSYTYMPNSYPNYITQYRTYNTTVDPTDINRYIIRF